MGASFRNVNQIVRLAGSDLLTISTFSNGLRLQRERWNAGSIQRRQSRVRASDCTSMKRHSGGCTTKTPWRPRSWPRVSVSSTATPATSRNIPCRRSPPESGEKRPHFLPESRRCGSQPGPHRTVLLSHSLATKLTADQVNDVYTRRT